MGYALKNIQEKVKDLWLRDYKFNKTQTARDFSINIKTVVRWVRRWEKEYGIGVNEDPDPSNLYVKKDEDIEDISKDTMTEEELKEDFEKIRIESVLTEDSGSISGKGKTKQEEFSQKKVIDLTILKAGVDLNQWKIMEAKVGFWHTGMKPRVIIRYLENGKPVYEDRIVRVTQWTVNIKLKPTRNNFLGESIRKLVDKVIPIDPINLPHLPLKTNKYAAEMSPVDIHFGKMAWGMETLAGNMDLKTTKKVFIESAMENLSEIALYPVSKIFIILGHDLMHFENYLGITPKGGHILDIDDRLPKAIQVTKESLIYVIDQAAQIAPVSIKRIPGNHDLHASYWMCEIIKERYRNNKHVDVDNGPSARKVILWGDLLIGLTHDASGRKQAPTVNLLPQFWPKEWGRSRWREWHTGHKHKKESTKFAPIFTLGSVIIRQVAGLTNIDYWHFDEVFVDAVPAMESFILHKDSGVRSNINHNIDYKKL